jgi:hypothetical protein
MKKMRVITVTGGDAALRPHFGDVFYIYSSNHKGSFVGSKFFLVQRDDSQGAVIDQGIITKELPINETQFQIEIESGQSRLNILCEFAPLSGNTLEWRFYLGSEFRG